MGARIEFPADGDNPTPAGNRPSAAFPRARGTRNLVDLGSGQGAPPHQGLGQGDDDVAMVEQKRAGLGRGIGQISVHRGRRSDNDLGQGARVVGVDVQPRAAKPLPTGPHILMTREQDN